MSRIILSSDRKEYKTELIYHNQMGIDSDATYVVAYFEASKDEYDRWEFTELWTVGYIKAGHFFDKAGNHINNVFAIAQMDEIYPEIRMEE